MASLGDYPIHSCELDVPYRWMWLARVRLTDANGPAEGDRVTLTIGPLSLVGTVLGAGVHAGQATARVVGGAGGWRQAPTGLSFQNDGNLSRSDIAKALASSVGETVEAEPGTLGINWSFDPLASAGANLDTLGTWYMRDDGVTVLGERPELGEFVATVPDFEGMEGRATCLIEEYQADKLMPGALVSSRSLENAIRVKHARFLYSTTKFVAEVSSVEQQPNRLAEHAARKSRFLGTYLYRIIEQIDGRLQLQAVDGVRGIPDQALVTKSHGIPGVESSCSPSGEVLVVFANGNPDKPRVLAYLGASQGETFTAPSVTFTTSTVLPAPEPVALAPALDTLQNALIAFCGTISGAPNPAAALALLQGACATLSGALAANVRTGSIVVDAQ